VGIGMAQEQAILFITQPQLLILRMSKHFVIVQDDYSDQCSTNHTSPAMALSSWLHMLDSNKLFAKFTHI